MNLLYGRVVAIFSEDGILAGKVRVGGAFKRVFLDLSVDPRIGDRVLICDGVAIGKVEDQAITEINYVSGNPR